MAESIEELLETLEGMIEFLEAHERNDLRFSSAVEIAQDLHNEIFELQDELV